MSFDLYLGWDGSYVLSKSPLKKLYDKAGGNYFLSPVGRGARCLDVSDGWIVFPKLKMWDVVRLTITVSVE